MVTSIFIDSNNYLLSMEEQEFLVPFEEIYSSTFSKYHTFEYDFGDMPAEERKHIYKLEKSHFRSQCYLKKLDVQHALDIAGRFSQSKWFFFIVDADRQRGRKAPPIFSYFTSDDPKKEIDIIPLENPAFYNTVDFYNHNVSNNFDYQSYIADCRDALGLSSEYWYLQSAHYNVLSMILHACGTVSTAQPAFFAYPKDALTQKYFANGIPISNEKPEEERFMSVASEMKGGEKAFALVSRIFDAPAQSQSDLSLSNPPTGFTVFSPRKMTDQHNEVFNVICSYFQDGQMVFTDTGICNTLHIKATSEQREMINKLILDMMFDVITIDTGNMGDFYNFTHQKITGHVLPIHIIEGSGENQFGNFISRRYIFTEEPVFLTYASLLKQIARYPRDVLDTNLNMNLETLKLHFYLAERICAISASSSKMSNHIVYDSVLLALGINPAAASAKKKSTIRKRARSILFAWQSKGYIHGFHEETKSHKRLPITGETRRGVSSHCIVIDGKPQLMPKSDA